MGVLGYRTIVRASGESTSFQDEPMSPITWQGLTHVYQIDDFHRQIWDREEDLVFHAAGTTIEATDIVMIDHLFGLVQFTEAKASVTVSGNYLPMENVAFARDYSLPIASTLLDATGFYEAQLNNGQRMRFIGMLDASLSISRLWTVGSEFQTNFYNRTPMLFDVRPGGGELVFRGWFVAETANLSGGVEDLESEELNFQANEVNQVAFAWGEVPLPPGDITGFVVDSEGDPIIGATVETTIGGVVYDTTTGGSGEYLLDDVPVGMGYTLTASAVGYVTGYRYGVFVNSEQVTPNMNFTLLDDE